MGVNSEGVHGKFKKKGNFLPGSISTLIQVVVASLWDEIHQLVSKVERN